MDIWRLPVPPVEGVEPTQIIDLPRGIDTGWESSLATGADTGHMDLYFERWDCSNQDRDVYVARGVDADQTA